MNATFHIFDYIVVNNKYESYDVQRKILLF